MSNDSNHGTWDNKEWPFGTKGHEFLLCGHCSVCVNTPSEERAKKLEAEWQKAITQPCWCGEGRKEGKAKSFQNCCGKKKK